MDDLEAFQAYRTDPVLARHQGWQPVSDDEARVFLVSQSHQMLGKECQWLQVAITRRDTAKLIGDLGLCVVDIHNRVLEIGCTVSQAAQRNGYAHEAIDGVLNALLGRGYIRSVVANTDVRNVAAIVLLNRLGFVHERSATTDFRGEPCQVMTFVLPD